jgi:hypothetical protein
VVRKLSFDGDFRAGLLSTGPRRPNSRRTFFCARSSVRLLSCRCTVRPPHMHIACTSKIMDQTGRIAPVQIHLTESFLNGSVLLVRCRLQIRVKTQQEFLVRLAVMQLQHSKSGMFYDLLDDRNKYRAIYTGSGREQWSRADGLLRVRGRFRENKRRALANAANIHVANLRPQPSMRVVVDRPTHARREMEFSAGLCRRRVAHRPLLPMTRRQATASLSTCGDRQKGAKLACGWCPALVVVAIRGAAHRESHSIRPPPADDHHLTADGPEPSKLHTVQSSPLIGG